MTLARYGAGCGSKKSTALSSLLWNMGLPRILPPLFRNHSSALTVSNFSIVCLAILTKGKPSLSTLTFLGFPLLSPETEARPSSFSHCLGFPPPLSLFPSRKRGSPTVVVVVVVVYYLTRKVAAANGFSRAKKTKINKKLRKSTQIVFKNFPKQENDLICILVYPR